MGSCIINFCYWKKRQNLQLEKINQFKIKYKRNESNSSNEYSSAPVSIKKKKVEFLKRVASDTNLTANLPILDTTCVKIGKLIGTHFAVCTKVPPNGRSRGQSFESPIF